MSKNEINPSPARLVESLRDTGYNFGSAISDIVDNSIAANATQVHLFILSEVDGNVKILIADNGDGLDEDGIKNALKYGSEKRANPKSLGKFGMGLKTASTSFCRHVAILSKQSNIYHSKALDLNHIIKNDTWELIDKVFDAEERKILDDIAEKNGTLIVLDNIDRLAKITHSSTEKNQIKNAVKILKEKLTAVFGKFMLSSQNPIKIFINGEELVGWDPFCNWMDDCIRVEEKIEIYNNDKSKVVGNINLSVHILKKKSLMTPEDLEKSRYKHDNQGFYVYREDRLISSGGWMRLWVKDPHFNLVRAEISFDHILDEHFQIDIKKSTIILPEDTKERLKEILTPLRREGEKRYRGTKKKVTGDNSDQLHGQSSNVINSKMDNNVGSEIKDINVNTGTATLLNEFGSTEIKLTKKRNNELAVEAVETLPNEELWNFTLTKDGKHAVQLNQSHEFYRRFYLNKHVNETSIQAMDSVFWALAESEMCTINKDAQRNLKQMRFKVSNILSELADELPELSEEEDLEDHAEENT